MSKVENELILAELRHYGHNHQKVARNLSISVQRVRDLDIYENSWNVKSKDGFGPEALRKYIVASKDVDQPWDNTDPQIVQAREDYESGLIEMVTGRDGNTLHLYAIPREVPAGERLYWNKKDEENGDS